MSVDSYRDLFRIEAMAGSPHASPFIISNDMAESAVLGT
jgi:hypothetical protein